MHDAALAGLPAMLRRRRSGGNGEIPDAHPVRGVPPVLTEREGAS